MNTKERVFLEVVMVGGDVAIEEVLERDTESYNYVDDKLHLTIYSDLYIDFSIGVYVGMYLAMKED